MRSSDAWTSNTVSTPISQLVLKRKREESPEEAGPSSKATNAPEATPAASSLTAKKAAPGPAPGPAPKRTPETLNPRHITNAPARHETRHRLVVLLHQEFVRLNNILKSNKDRAEERKQYCLNENGLIKVALDIEEQYAKSKSSAVYTDTIKHRVMGYKRMTIDQWVNERKEHREASRRQRTNATAPTPATAPPTLVETGLTPEQELELLKKNFITPIKGLARSGYVSTVPSPQDIQKAREAAEISKGWEVCDRCPRRFQVFPGRREADGVLASGGKCTFHFGRLNRASGTFTCCREYAGDSAGCGEMVHHVFKTDDPKRLALLWNFVETPPNDSVPETRAVCFDCEMAYTVHGMEVVRLTVTAWPSGDLMLDVLVRPFGEILDLNSRFSGVWPQDFENAVPYAANSGDHNKEEVSESKATDGKRPQLPVVASPEAARTLFHSLIRPETVLIGHALENDLNTMRMIHPRLVDTVLLYPHPRGLPFRTSLRELAKVRLDRTIQADTLGGHDSAEDARVAGEVVRAKVKSKWEKMKAQGLKPADLTTNKAE